MQEVSGSIPLSSTKLLIHIVFKIKNLQRPLIFIQAVALPIVVGGTTRGVWGDNGEMTPPRKP